MRLNIFKCSNKATRTGITADKTGSNLPEDMCQGGTWEYWQTIDMVSDEPARIGVASADVILEAIERDGYYINDTEITFTERVL